MNLNKNARLKIQILLLFGDKDKKVNTGDVYCALFTIIFSEK